MQNYEIAGRKFGIRSCVGLQAYISSACAGNNTLILVEYRSTSVVQVRSLQMPLSIDFVVLQTPVGI